MCKIKCVINKIKHSRIGNETETDLIDERGWENRLFVKREESLLKGENVLQLKDSCHDLTREFARVGLEWRLTHPDEALSEVQTFILCIE